MKTFIRMLSTTQQKTPEPEDRVATVKSFFGTILMILSGLILYLDKILNYFNITVNYEFKYYYDFESAVWHLSQTLAPLLIIGSLFFKPKKWSYGSPLAAFSIQLMFVLRDEHIIERDYFWAYTVAFIAFFFLMIFFTHKTIKLIAKKIEKVKNNNTTTSQNQSRYKKIKMLLNHVEELYEKDEINTETYIAVIENIEKDYINIKKEINEENAKAILNDYISKLP